MRRGSVLRAVGVLLTFLTNPKQVGSGGGISVFLQGASPRSVWGRAKPNPYSTA